MMNESCFVNENCFVVKAIPSSFVKRSMKPTDESGSGEAKLHIGTVSKAKNFDDFFAFDDGYTYRFTKENMLGYLNQVKLEYVYQKFAKYNNVSLEIWNKNYNAISSLDDGLFTTQLTRYTDKQGRYYIRSEDDIFSKTLREIILPRITNIVFDKNIEQKTIFMNIELNLDLGSADESSISNSEPRNWIVFGAPGTGKSFLLEQKRKELLGEDNETDYERVTFHPDYSYANFIGTYKPVMLENQEDNLSKDDREVISILTDNKKTAQDKYDRLYAYFRGDGITRLPILLGLYTDETFKTRKQDGSDAVGYNGVERNHGRAIRKYVKLFSNNNYESDGIAYQFVPGPFMRILANALKSVKLAESTQTNPKPYLLIIEEINRANAAAVFGDVFQLLDRGDNNESEYPIQTSKEMREYLAYAVDGINGNPDDYGKITIPNNMFIWATMNSADQGVFPMDTAFKRRWDFTYLGIDTNEEGIRGESFKIGSEEEQTITWNAIRKAINDFLARMNINEDKQLGPYFLSRSIISPNADVSEEEKDSLFCSAFKDKVLMYLFEDAARQKRNDLFDLEKPLRYSKICEEFDRIGIRIFNDDIRNNALKYSKDEVVEEVREEQGTVEFDNDAVNNADTDA